MIHKIILIILILFSLNCGKERDQVKINIDSIKSINDSINTLLSFDQNQVWLLEISINSMNNGDYNEAIENFNLLKSRYPNSILNRLVDKNIEFCTSQLDTLVSKMEGKTNIQIQAEKKTGVEILPVKSYWKEGKPGLKLVLKNITNKEIPKLKVEVQFLDEVNNLIFANGNYLLESSLAVEQSILANIPGNNEYEFSSQNVIAKIFIQTSGSLVYFKEITFKARSQLKNWRPNFKSK